MHPLRGETLPPFVASDTSGVGQAASVDACPRFSPNPLPFIFSAFNFSRRASHVASVRFCGPAFGVGHEPQPLSDVRRADARSANIARPDGVTRVFHVSVYKVEPSEAVFARNLLSKNDWRAALADEVGPHGPQVALVVEAFSFACAGEWLTGTRSRPDLSIVSPPSQSERMTPDADSGEKMALSIPGKVICSNIRNAPFIHIARRNQPGFNQVAQPLRRVRVEFVVVGAHAALLCPSAHTHSASMSACSLCAACAPRRFAIASIRAFSPSRSRQYSRPQ